MLSSRFLDEARGAVVGAALDRLMPYRPNRTRNTILTTLAFVGVGLVGAAIGLLFAPRSGRALRADLMERANDLKNRAIEAGEQIGQNIGQMAERAGAEVSEKVQGAMGQGEGGISPRGGGAQASQPRHG